MKKFWNILSLLLLSNASIFAQDLPKEFGQIHLTDFDYQYEFEPDADAVVLFDIGETEFVTIDSRLEIRFKRTKRIKINTKAGFAQGNISIPYYNDGRGKTEKVINIQATTYYIQNGSVQQKKLAKSDIYTEQVNKYWGQQKIALPNLQEGAIIEFQYTLQSPFHFNLPDWEFQSAVPTVYSQYIAKITPFYEYISVLQGASRFHHQSSMEDKSAPKYFGGIRYRDMVHTYAMKNIPSFKDETYITTKEDYIIKLDFQLSKIHYPQGGSKEVITTYPKLIKGLKDNDYFGKYLKKAKRLAKNILAKEISLTDASKLDNSKRIIEYVKNNYSWDGNLTKFTRKSPKEVVQGKRGNAAEINLLLIALLQEADIPVDPVILSTRKHGKLSKDYPFDHEYNYVLPLIEVETKSFLSDGTDPFTPYDRIPPRCMNNVGLRMVEDNPTWVKLNTDMGSRANYRMSIQPNLATNQLDVIVKTKFTEVEAYINRASHENKAVSIKEELAELNFENITNLTTEHYLQLDAPYKLAFKANYPLEGFDDKLLIQPFLAYPPTENLLKQATRTYPVDLIYRRTYNYGSVIDIPETYDALDLPEKSRIDNDLVKFYYTITKTEEQLKITAAITFKKAIYQPSDYAQLKDVMDLMVEKLNEPIVMEQSGSLK